MNGRQANSWSRRGWRGGALGAIAAAGIALVGVGVAGADLDASTGGATISSSAGASAVAKCKGTAQRPVKRGAKIIAKAQQNCTGPVAQQSLRVCLRQETASGFRDVKCKTKRKGRAGTLIVRVEKVCRPSANRDFITKAFLRIRAVGGDVATDSAPSNAATYPYKC